MTPSGEAASVASGIPRRVALVTGGAGGIGGGIVGAVTRRGFDVVVGDRSFSSEREADLRAKADPAARTAFVTGDIADLKDHPRFVDEVFAAFGRLDCLVNNAGVSVASRGDLLDVSVASYDTNFAVNTRAAFFLTQRVCRRVLAAEPHGTEGTRSVVFISSSNAVIAAPKRGEYAIQIAAASDKNIQIQSLGLRSNLPSLEVSARRQLRPPAPRRTSRLGRGRAPPTRVHSRLG